MIFEAQLTCNHLFVSHCYFSCTSINQKFTFVSCSQANSKSAQDSEKSTFGEDKLSPLHALFSPPGLQQMQQFLQHMANNNNNNNTNSTTNNNGGPLPGFNPSQLQHFMQQHNLLNQQQVSQSQFQILPNLILAFKKLT